MWGFYTLFHKEVMRFWKVAFQTILAPLISTLLYLLIFAQVLESRVQVYPGVGYAAFLVPGLAMMALLQNAFANSSSSLIQSKLTGNLVFILLPPLGHEEIYAAYTLAATVRGISVALGVCVVTLLFFPVPLHEPLWALVFALLGSVLLGSMGIIAGIWAEKFDQLAAFQNFIIMPLTFLSGVFYSIHSLSPFWQTVSRLNPFLYLVDGFRYGFFGVSDIPPGESLAIVGGATLALSLTTVLLLRSGFRLRH